MGPFATEDMPDLSGKPILILAGKRDSMVPADETERLAKMLKGAEADVEVRWADAPHAITAEEVGAAKEWLTAKFSGGSRA